MPTVASIDTRQAVRLVSPEPGAVGGDLRPDRSGGVLQPSDLAAQPDRVLRRAPAGVQRDRVPAPRARPAAGRRAAREAVRARHRSGDRGVGRAAQRRVHDLAVARRGPRLRARVRRGRHRRDVVDSLPARSRSKASTPRSSTRRCTRKRSSTCGIGCRTSRSDARSAIRRCRRIGAIGRIADRRHRHRPADCRRSVVIPAGDATLGADRDSVAFGWDNEFDAHDVHVPAFDIDALPVTNAQFLEFINAGGYSRRELWSDEGWEWIQAEACRTQPSGLPADHRPRPRISDPRSPIRRLAMARNVRAVAAAR